MGLISKESKLRKSNGSKLRKSNGLKVDTDGYCYATLISVDEILNDYTEEPQFEWSFEVPLESGDSTIMRVWSDMTVNHRKYSSKNYDEPTYNKLTMLIVAFDVIAESDLKTFDPDSLDCNEIFESLEGTKVKFKLMRVPNKNLETIDLTTLQTIKNP